MIKKWSQFNEFNKSPSLEGIQWNRAIKKENPEWLLYISTEIEEDARRSYESAIDSVFSELHDKYNTISGDADFTTDTLMSDYTGSAGLNLIETTVYQVIRNMDMSSIAKSLKSDRVDLKILAELKDERDSLEDEDEVILVTSEEILYDYHANKTFGRSQNGFNSCNNRLIKVVVGWYSTKSDNVSVLSKEYINGKQNSASFSIEECILVVKKETYEDFAGSLK